jgi:hypothetical protein
MRFKISVTHNLLLEPILHASGVNADSTYVELGNGELEVAMGRWFHERIPLADISAVAPSEWPWYGGLGVKLHHHGIGVVGSTEGIVNVKLKAPRKMRAVAMFDSEQLWISLEDPDGFMKALSKAAGVAISPFAKFWGD